MKGDTAKWDGKPNTRGGSLLGSSVTGKGFSHQCKRPFIPEQAYGAGKRGAVLCLCTVRPWIRRPGLLLSVEASRTTRGSPWFYKS